MANECLGTLRESLPDGGVEDVLGRQALPREGTLQALTRHVIPVGVGALVLKEEEAVV